MPHSGVCKENLVIKKGHSVLVSVHGLFITRFCFPVANLFKLNRLKYKKKTHLIF